MASNLDCSDLGLRIWPLTDQALGTPRALNLFGVEATG